MFFISKTISKTRDSPRFIVDVKIKSRVGRVVTRAELLRIKLVRIELSASLLNSWLRLLLSILARIFFWKVRSSPDTFLIGSLIMIKKIFILFVICSSLTEANDRVVDVLSKDEFIGFFTNYKNILGNKIGRIDSILESMCRRDEVKMLHPFSPNGYSYAYACKIDSTRFLIGLNDETPKKLIDDFILVTSLGSFDKINERVISKYGKCKYPRTTSAYSTCTYSIGVDPSTKLGRIVTFDRDMEKRATIFRLSVESGDGF
jgi:hypothetical protein